MKPHIIHPVEKASQLEGFFREIFQNPRKLLKNYIREGMTVIDFGCGPGFFTSEAAKLVGESGRVVAVDLQKGMLDLVKQKIVDTKYEKRIMLHQCESHSIGLQMKVDFIWAFYAIHEVPDKERVLRELTSLLKPGGKLLIAEQKGHVIRKDFEEIVRIAVHSGLRIIKSPAIFISRAVLLENSRK